MQNIFMAFEVLLGLGIIISVYMQPSKADALSGLIQGTAKDTFFAKTNQELRK